MENHPRCFRISDENNAAGQKVKKTVYDTTNNTVKEVEYLDGFQYTGGELNFFPHAEGYVNVTKSNSVSNPYIYNYVYNYTDHLGNIRLSYTKDAVTGELEILEENHYYPFGLKHKVYARSLKMDFKEDEELEGVARPEYVYSTKYNYKYNGKELQDELGLSWTSMDFRNYDAAIGRFHNLDPLAEYSMSWSPFRFAYDNPVFWSDPTGLFESNGFETCPTCPNTPEFKPFIDDPDNEYVYDPNTNTVTPVIELNEATVTGKKKDSDNSEKALGVGLDVTENLGGLSSSILKDRFKYGEKYYNKPITVRTKLGPGINTNANSLKNLQKAGKISGKIVKGLVVADIAMSGEIRASHVLTATMIGVNAIPVVGNAISGIYFGADLITMGASYFMTGEAKGIGDYLDESLDGGVILEAKDVGIDYEGVYK